MNEPTEPPRETTSPPVTGPRKQSGPDLGAVLGGVVLVAIAAALAVQELFGTTWDWKYWAAGALVVAGFFVVLASVISAARAGSRGR